MKYLCIFYTGSENALVVLDFGDEFTGDPAVYDLRFALSSQVGGDPEDIVVTALVAMPEAAYRVWLDAGDGLEFQPQLPVQKVHVQ